MVFNIISYLIWKHVACNKLQLVEDLAWVYVFRFKIIFSLFYTFLTISSTNSEKLKEIESFLFNCDNKCDQGNMITRYIICQINIKIHYMSIY